MAPRVRPLDVARRGHTLLELITVLVVLGALAVVGAASLRPDLLGNLTSRTDARRLAADLIRARRLAISSGDNHLIVPRQDGQRNIVGYTLQRRLPDGRMQPADGPHDFPQDVRVVIEPRGAVPEFDLEGAALGGYHITLWGPTRGWELAVAQATGSVRVRER